MNVKNKLVKRMLFERIKIFFTNNYLNLGKNKA